MDISQLREAVVGLLTASPDLIGDYVFPNGTTIPAVYVVGRQSVPSEWKVTGMEVTMREFPDLLPTPMVGTIRSRQLWEVVLVQYDSDADQLTSAMQRMVRRFPDATVRYFPGDDIAYRRCRFVIPDTEILRRYPGP